MQECSTVSTGPRLVANPARVANSGRVAAHVLLSLGFGSRCRSGFRLGLGSGLGLGLADVDASAASHRAVVGVDLTGADPASGLQFCQLKMVHFCAEGV